MVVAAEGKDIKEALENLKADRETLAGKLKELGAADEAVQFGEPRIGAAGGALVSAQQRMMAQMIRMRQMGNRAAKPDAGEPEPVAVSLTATAEWPLDEASSPEAFLVSAYELREKLRSGGLAKAAAAPAKELTPEEQEEQEEMAAMMDDDGDGSGGPKPGEPAFVFVRRVAPAEHDAATAEAFAKAKAAAARLAAAAGGKLGELRTVSGSASAADAGGDEDVYAMQRAMFQQMGVNTGGDGADVEEATAAEPGPVTLELSVTAAFAIR